jgi:hypothetical protein
MDSHPWLSDFLAAAMLAVAVYCIARLVRSLRSNGVTQRDTDAVHAVMGVSMAGMLVPSLTAAPNGLWLVVFSGSALWFGYKVLHDSERASINCHPSGSHLPHLLMCAAMIYMLAVMDWTPSMHTSHGVGMLAMGSTSASGSPWPLFAVALTVLLVGDVAVNAGLTLRRLMPAAPVPSRTLALAQVGEAAYVLDVADGRGEVQSINHPLDVTGRHERTSNFLAPRSAVICQLVMCLVMGYMLVTLA